MRVRILGSSGGYPVADNPASGYLLESRATRVWLDAGTGSFAALQGAEEDFMRLDAVVLSHGHADHCLDVVPFFYALHLQPEPPEPVPLYAPRDAWDRLGRFLGGEEKLALARVLDFHPLRPGSEVEIGDLALTFLRTEHPVETLAVRATSPDGVLTYSADTGPATDLAGFAAGSDLLLCEATYQEGRSGPPVHLSARQAGDAAARAEVRSLALTHLFPLLEPSRSLEEARKTADGVPVSVARPGKVYQVEGG